MFRMIFWKEMREHLMTFRFGAALITTFVLVIASVWVLGSDYIRRLNNYNTLSEHAAQRAREVFVPSQIVPIIHRPPSPLAVFAQGEEKRLGSTVEIHRWSIPAEAEDNLTDNSLISADTSFDFLTIFTLVVSLFGILISYDVISGERERGTLKLLCSCGSGRRMIYTVKFLAGTAALAIPCLISFLCAMLVLQVVLGISFSGVRWLAVAMMFLSGLIFAAFFVALGLLCSAVARRSSTALVMALFFWTLSIVLIPSNSGEIAKAAIDLPPSEEIAAFERSSSEALFAEMDNFRESHARQAGFGMGCVNIGSENGSLFDSWAQGWTDTQKYIRFIEPLWQKRAEMIWNLEQKHTDKKRAQSELAESLACISPASYLRRIFSGLAGTDYQAYADFMENARRYRGAFLDTLRSKGLFDDNVLSLFSRRTKDEITDEKFRERKRVYDEKLQRGEPWGNVLNWSRWNPLPKDYVPAFRYDFAGIDFEETLWPFGILVFGAAVVFSLGFAAFLRYDVR